MKYQSLYKICFSDDRSYRWKRHFLFLLAIFIYHLLRIGIMLPDIHNRQALASLLNMSLTWGLLPNMFLSYATVYYLVPRFFDRKKYIAFFLGILILILAMLAYSMIRNYFNYYFNFNYTDRHAIGIPYGISFNTFRPGIIRTFGNPPLICCLLLSLKTLKNWHLEQLKTETLAKENASAELQLLKAQVHPHFLFNTLNNIYSFSLDKSLQAGVLVRKLSDMLNYMIHECEQPLVALERELKLIEDYTGLEKVRYSNRLEIDVAIEGDCDNKLIAPLLLIPFVENSFKHGASVMRGQQWIRLRITVKQETLYFDLSNSKPQLAIRSNNKGIGLVNVRKRLELLYPQNHFLKIESTETIYSVQLQIHLQPLSSLEIPYKPTTLKLQSA
jgi:hypothetical protein